MVKAKVGGQAVLGRQWLDPSPWLIEGKRYYINLFFRDTIFVLWGKDAREKKTYISNKVSIVATVHPPGLSANRGFIGSRLFSQINNLLEKNKMLKINW